MAAYWVYAGRLPGQERDPCGQWGSMGDLLQRTSMNTVKRMKEYERKQRIPTFLTTSVIMSAWRAEAYLKRKQNELQKRSVERGICPS